MEAVDNSGGDDDGAGLRSITDLGASVGISSPTTTWTLAPGVRGLASSVGDEPSAITPRFNGSVAHRSPRRTVTGTLSVIPEFVDDADFEDAGRQSDSNALQISVSGRLGMTYAFGPRDSGSVGVFGRIREYTESSDNLSPSQSWGVDGGWSRMFSPTITGTLTPSLTFFSSDSDTGSDGETFSLRAGFEQRIDPRLTITGSLGPAVTRSRDAGEDGGEDTTIGAVGGLTLAYRGQATTYSLGFSQDVGQDSDGELENSTALRAGVSHSINSVSRVGLSAFAGLQTPLVSDGEADRTAFSVSPSYSYDLTDDWSLNLGYQFRFSDRDEVETTNLVFLRISRGLSLLP